MQRLWRSKTNYDAAKQPKQTPTQTQLMPKQTVAQNKPNQKLLLPNQIGCRIIELEMEIMETQNLNKQIILQLLHQYSQAIEFYEERGSPKHLLYQKKMQNFLHKPAISQILKGKTGTLLVKREKNKQELQKVQNESQFYVKKLIQNNKQTVQKQQEIVKKQLESQQKNLEERLQRKRINSNKFTKGTRLVSASFSVPTKQNTNQPKDQEVILTSEFVDLDQPQNRAKILQKQNTK